MGREKRRCANCGLDFEPDARNAKHHQYCGAEACKAASKRASQAKWLAKNPGYHRGFQAVARVRAWRQKHPGYSRRKPALPNGSPIQESLPFETGASELAQTEILAPPQFSSAPPAPPIETSIQESLTLKPGAAEPTPTEILAPPQLSSAPPAPPIETSIQESLTLKPGAAEPTPTEILAPPQLSSAPPAPPIETSIQESLTLKPGAAEPTPTESLAPPQISSAPPIETSIQEILPLEPGAAKPTPTPTESLAPPQKSCNAFAAPLQDLLNAQPIVLIGLISHLWGSALQDDIALILIRLIQLGLDIRGGHLEHAHETNIESGTPAPGA